MNHLTNRSLAAICYFSQNKTTKLSVFSFLCYNCSINVNHTYYIILLCIATLSVLAINPTQSYDNTCQVLLIMN